MPDQVIRLLYPPHLLDVPVINQLIRRFNLTFNIIRAEVTPDYGWVDLQITGSSDAGRETRALKYNKNQS